MYSFFNVIIAFFFLSIIRDKDVFFNYPIRIKALSITFPASIFSPVKAVDRFSAIFSAFAKSLT
jgi:hypothetical protein